MKKKLKVDRDVVNTLVAYVISEHIKKEITKIINHALKEGKKERLK